MSRATVGWCLYDLANTVLVFNMTMYHFPVWVVIERGGTELAYGLAYGGSMLASALMMPWVGRRSDWAGRRVPALGGWTLACVVLTAGLSWITPLAVALVTFALSNVCYQLALVCYNALLPVVALPDRLGRVSGYGVAWGYVGNVVGILATAPVVRQWGRQAAFLPTALLFLVLAIPAFLWIPETANTPPRSAARVRPLSLWSPQHRALRGVLTATFWSLNAVSAILAFISVYARQAIGFSEAQLQQFLFVVTVAAAVGAMACGRLADRVGGYRTLWWIWAVWAVVFLVSAFPVPPLAFWIIGCLAGVVLGGAWVTFRVVVVSVVRRAHVGEAFGWLGVVLSLSAVIGPLLWGAIVWIGTPLGPTRYHLAMASLLVFHLIGWWWYHRLQPAVEGALKDHRTR